MNRWDAIVVGCGVMGSAITANLARSGLRVLNLERFGLNHANGSSHGKSRIIRSAYAEDPRYVPLVKRAFKLWRELESKTGERLLRMTGALYLGARDSSFLEGAERSAKENALPYETLGSREIAEGYPSLRPGSDDVALRDPTSGVLFPESCVRAFARVAAETGRAEFHFNEVVLKWSSTGGEGVSIATDKQEYSAAKLVLACGSWLPALVPGLSLHLTCERQVSLWFSPAPSAAASLRVDVFPVVIWCVAGSDACYYAIPDFGAGVKCAAHHGGQITSPDTVTRSVAEADVAPVRRFLQEHIPGAAGPLVASEVCLYTNTPDGHFLIDFHPAHPNVLLVSPCSGHGFKFAPVVGEIAGDLAAGGRPRYDSSLFRIDRLLRTEDGRRRGPPR